MVKASWEGIAGGGECGADVCTSGLIAVKTTRKRGREGSTEPGQLVGED